jgi:predicted  nucleic acid-binding Zn-ribbon protein
VWWVSDINTRLQVTEGAVSNVKETDTSALQERIATLETENKNLHLDLESLQTDIENVESNVSIWAEKEFQKLYDIINKGNPLNQ